VLNRTLPITLLLVLACVPVAAAAPRAHSAAQQRAEASLEDAKQVLEGHDIRTGREATLALRELATRIRHLRGDERRDAIALLSRPTNPDSPPDERFTVPEEAPLCNENFCVHWVASTADVATPLQVGRVLDTANAVRSFENGTLDWREPPDDGDGRVDIYLKDLGEQRLFGFAATDPQQEELRQHSYLVIDNDFDPTQFGGADELESLRVTLAHEYGHVLQYGYDVLADPWHFESSAVWMEQRMYPEITDWLRFLNDGATGEGWGALTELPLTYFELDPDADDAADPRTAKPYGDVVWNDFLSAKYATEGDALQRATWERSNGFEHPSTDTYDDAIRAAGGDGFAPDFAEFSAAVAEWQVPASTFPAATELPDVERRGELARDGDAVSLEMDHLSFALYDIPATVGPLRLAASFPRGTSAAIALVARSGATEGGEVTTALRQLPNGGLGAVTIDEPSEFYESRGRITAVVVNSDSSHGLLWRDDLGDWRWKRDGQDVTARVTSDTGAPRASLRRFRLRSRDAEPLTYVATLRQDGDTVGRRSGRIRSGATRRLRIRGGDDGRARLVVRLADPSANKRRLTRTLRLAR
jgi:hypothetical protein